MIIRILFTLILSTLITRAADWPTVKGAMSRDGRSSEKLSFPLNVHWSHASAHVPAPAWPASANLNFQTGQLLENAMTYDRCYHPVIANGKLYYGSSADDTLYCVNAKTGESVWKFVTGAPVRIAPVIYGQSLLAGSDDGHVYSLNAATGELLWKFRGGPESSVRSRMFLGNGRMISRWPVRCGIVADEGTLYFTSGLFPVEGVFLHALKIADGSEIWRSEINVSAQGHMLASKETLFITTGRNTPVNSFSRENGKKIKHYGSTRSWGKDLTGGSDAILIDDQLISGPSEGRQAHVYNINAPANQISKIDAIGIIADATSIYSATPLFAKEQVFQIKSLNRATNSTNLMINSAVDKLNVQLKKLKSKKNSETKELEEEIKKKIETKNALKKAAWQWEINVKRPYSLLLDSESLYAGFDGCIRAYAISDGSELWKQDLEGGVYGMAISDGSLFVSTDKGILYCLKKEVNETPRKSATGKVVQENQRLPNTLHAFLQENGLSDRPGFCLIVDAIDGTLALKVIASTGCRVITVSSNPALSAKLRDRFARAGVYGTRVVVHEITAPGMPYPSCFADLIMSEAAFINGELPIAPKQLYKYLRPDGGILAMTLPSEKSSLKILKEWGESFSEDWSVSAVAEWGVGALRRPALEGAGSWTHGYADSGGTSSSGDVLVNDQMDIQWFGDPGPSGMVDRHYRAVPPLYMNGRLFVPGDNRIYGINPYNGSILWEKEIPDSRRTGAFLDAGSMAVDKNSIYVAFAGKCLALDVEEGGELKTYHLPLEKPGETLDWGLVGQSEDLLLGSTCTKGSSHSSMEKSANRFLWRLGMPVVTSVNIFAMDKKTAKARWIYSGGKILNSSIVFNNKKLYFLEVSGSVAATNNIGRMKVSELFAEGNQEIVALSMATGKEIFRRKIDPSSFTEPVFLQLANETLLLSGSKPEEGALRYSYYTYNAETGAEQWNTSHIAFENLANDGHGQQNRHPVIIGNTVYAWPYAYKLDTGNKVEGWKMDRRGHGCGGVSGSANSLFWRGGNPWMISPETGESAKRLTQVTRPGCWINIIPAGGLIMIPEASSGCTCGYSIQTSLTFGPRKK